MKLIQDFYKKQDTLKELIESISEDWVTVAIGDDLIRELIIMIAEEFKVTEDLIGWWLHEKVDKVLYIENEEFSVRTLEEFHDFLVKECCFEPIEL